MSRLTRKSDIFRFFSLFAALRLSHIAQLSAQPADYLLKRDLGYYPQNQQLDDYQSAHYKLELYFPCHQTGFATIVWFPGDGLVAGEKYFPQGLLEQNIAVVAVNPGDSANY